MAFLGGGRGCCPVPRVASPARNYLGGTTNYLTLCAVRIGAPSQISWLRCGLWRSLVSALVWGTRGRRFKSSQPDVDEARHLGVSGRHDNYLAPTKVSLSTAISLWLCKGEVMKSKHYISLLTARAADARAIIMFFAVFHTGLLIVLGFGGSGLEDSGVQLALATVTVLTSLWTVFFLDDCMQDLFACGQDLSDRSEDFKASNIGRRFTAVPVPVFRVVNFVVIALIVVAELLAIY